MPEITAAGGQKAASVGKARAQMVFPAGNRNRKAARVQAGVLRWLVRIAAGLTAAVLLFLIGYILVMGIPNLKPSLFSRPSFDWRSLVLSRQTRSCILPSLAETQ